MEHKNIFPVFEHLTQREEKEKLLHQHAIAVWICGLSGSGKTTIAIDLEQELFKRGYISQILDADNIRTTINKDLGFSIEDRQENIRRISEITKLFLNNGMITINCFISPTAEIRDLAKEIIGKNDFVEVFLNAPFEICKQRDPKGLYQKASSGKINEFTGVSSPFEPPTNADIIIPTDQLSVKESSKKILDYILPKIEFNHND